MKELLQVVEDIIVEILTFISTKNEAFLKLDIAAKHFNKVKFTYDTRKIVLKMFTKAAVI